MIRTICRTFRTLQIIGRYRLDTLYPSHCRFLMRLALRCNPFSWRPIGKLSSATRLKLALTELGPIYIKFGQLLSTRRDFLRPDIANELAELQDRVPAFDGQIAISAIEQAFNQPLSDLFKIFDDSALASASVAQVHAATLHSDEEVVVKVLRPNIKTIIENDIRIMKAFARILQSLSRRAKLLNPIKLVEEYERIILGEIDLVSEAANLSQMQRLFPNSTILTIPKVSWDFVTRNILVMQRVHGTPIANIDELKEKHVNFSRLAKVGVEVFFTQVFQHCFFHADMHPGNIFVDTRHPDRPKLVVVDYGIVGTLSRTDQKYLAENFLAFFKRDYRKIAELHIESGWVASDVRVDEFESAIRTACEPILSRQMKNLSFADLFSRLIQTATEFKLVKQPQLFLLQKTLVNLEGLGRSLFPDTAIWEKATPFLEKWMRERKHPKAIIRNLKETAPAWLEILNDLPSQLKTNRSNSITEKPLTPIRPFITGTIIGALTVASIFLFVI